MRATYLVCACIAFCTIVVPRAPGSVLTPYRKTDVEVQTRYPTYPYPNYPDYAVYRTLTDGDTSLFGSHIARTAVRPDDSSTSYGLAEASATFGKVRAGSDAMTAADRAQGTATATASFGDSFTVEGGPASGTARMVVLFEGRLDRRYATYGQFPNIGAWAWLEVTLTENFVGGGRLTHTTIYPHQLEHSSAPGVRITPLSALWDGDTVRVTELFEFPYQTGRDYFMDLSLSTVARYNGFAHFMNSGSITGFQVEPGASVSFGSGTPLAQYNVPEPASAGLLLAGGTVLGLRRRRSAGH